MRTLPILASGEPQRYTFIQHVYNVHLASGKWSVHLDTVSGRGRFYGPQCNEGTLSIFGKVVRSADCHLPRQVVQALTEGGYDCGHVTVV